jgi:hypothetical protein
MNPQTIRYLLSTPSQVWIAVLDRNPILSLF